MRKKPTKVVPQIRVDVYGIISDAVEDGLRWGWQHAHKHSDNPGKDAIIDAMHNDIMNQVTKYLTFGSDND